MHFNLNSSLKLLFLLIIINNNLLFKICCERVRNVTFLTAKYYLQLITKILPNKNSNSERSVKKMIKMNLLVGKRFDCKRKKKERKQSQRIYTHSVVCNFVWIGLYQM